MPHLPNDARVYVAGHAGLVGSAVVRRLRRGRLRNEFAPADDGVDRLEAVALDARAVRPSKPSTCGASLRRAMDASDTHSPSRRHSANLREHAAARRRHLLRSYRLQRYEYRVVEDVAFNDAARAALKDLCGADYDFDRPGWRRWFVENAAAALDDWMRPREAEAR